MDNRTILLSEAGGFLSFVRDGELLVRTAVPAGRIPLRDYLDLAPDGAEVELSDGLVALQPRQIGGLVKYGSGSHESGANPDFTPTTATAFERELRQTVSMLSNKVASMATEARMNQLKKVERVPEGPRPDLKEGEDVVKKVERVPEGPRPDLKKGEQVVE